MTQCVTIIIASLVALKKSSKGFPGEPNFPSAVPNTTLNITIPSTFVVAEFTCLKFHRCRGTVFFSIIQKKGTDTKRCIYFK